MDPCGTPMMTGNGSDSQHITMTWTLTKNQTLYTKCNIRHIFDNTLVLPLFDYGNII